MTEDEILTQVTALMREYFDDDDLVLTPETTASDVEEWDSLSHVNIMASIEQRFGIKILVGEMDNLKNIGDLVRLIARKARR